MWTKIVNPKTGRKVNVNNKLGMEILRRYLTIIRGGSSMVEDTQKDINSIRWLFLGFGKHERPGLLKFLKKKYAAPEEQISVTTLGLDGDSDIDYDLNRLLIDFIPNFSESHSYFTNLELALNNKHVKKLFKTYGDFYIERLKPDQIHYRLGKRIKVKALPITPPFEGYILGIPNRIENNFDAIVWENGIRTQCCGFKIESLEKIYKILKPGGKFYLPEWYQATDDDPINHFFTYNGQVELAFEDASCWNYDRLNTWAEYIRNPKNTSPYSLKNANGIRKYQQQPPERPKGLKESGIIDAKGRLILSEEEKKDNEYRFAERKKEAENAFSYMYAEERSIQNEARLREGLAASKAYTPSP